MNVVGLPASVCEIMLIVSLILLYDNQICSVGFITGIALCSTLFSVVGSACKSVIVLYAEAPNEFQANHPELSSRMRASWQQAWPVDFKY